MALIKVIDSLTNQEPLPNVLVTVALALLFLYFIFNFQTPSRSLPIINARKPFEFSNNKLKERYRTHAKELLESGLQKVCFLRTNAAEQMLISNRANPFGSIPTRDLDLFLRMNMPVKFMAIRISACQETWKMNYTAIFRAWRHIARVIFQPPWAIWRLKQTSDGHSVC